MSFNLNLSNTINKSFSSLNCITFSEGQLLDSFGIQKLSDKRLSELDGILQKTLKNFSIDSLTQLSIDKEGVYLHKDFQTKEKIPLKKSENKKLFECLEKIELYAKRSNLIIKSPILFGLNKDIQLENLAEARVKKIREPIKNILLKVSLGCFFMGLLAAFQAFGSTYISNGINDFFSFQVKFLKAPAQFITTLGGALYWVFATKKSNSIQDHEGFIQFLGRSVGGVFSLIGSGLQISAMVLGVVGAGAVQTTVGLVGGAFFAIDYFLGASAAIMNMYRCHTLNNHINEFLDNSKLSEEEQIRGALLYLRDKIYVTQKEKQKIIDELDPNLTPEEKTKALEKQLKNLQDFKIEHLKRRLNGQTIVNLKENIDTILRNLDNPQEKALALEKGKELIKTVKTGILRKAALHFMMLTASILGLTALILISVFSKGAILALPILLYITAYIIWFSPYGYKVIRSLKQELFGKSVS